MKDKLLGLIEEGLLDKDFIIMCFVKWLNEAELKEMLEANDINI